MNRAVIDPNVLISAFTSQRGSAQDRIVRAWREGAFELVVSSLLTAELDDVLGRPEFERQAADGRADAYVAALSIVSGDRHLTGLDTSTPRVLTPRRFLDELG